MKSWFEAAAVLVAGAVLGSFLGKFIATVSPQGKVHDLLANDITAGLQPAHLDLRVVDLTFGCLFHFNLLSIVGVLIAAFLYKRLLR
ncbi:MAG: DUF4321 domain-containing protein [Elusimicrobia bacterium]|nr:DUF4321 domain-containing protein [Elusimicrobiota bacterium]